MSEPTAPILVLAIGNPSRGDDAVGPILGERLMQWRREQPPLIANQLDVIAEQQLMVEHLLDMQGRQHILFIDAAASGVEGHRLAPILPSPPPPLPGHACHPGELLGLYRQTFDTPPPATLLAIEGQQFELGQALSESTVRHMDAGWLSLLQCLSELLGMPSPCA